MKYFLNLSHIRESGVLVWASLLGERSLCPRRMDQSHPANSSFFTVEGVSLFVGQLPLSLAKSSKNVVQMLTWKEENLLLKALYIKCCRYWNTRPCLRGNKLITWSFSPSLSVNKYLTIKEIWHSPTT